MKKKNSIFFVFFVFFAGFWPATAQNQEGSAAIAESIRADGEGPLLRDGPDCVLRLTKEGGMEKKAAAKLCKSFAEIQAKTSRRVANEAADATKASRPLLVYGRYGYGGGYYGGYYGRSYGYSRPVVVRSAPVRRPAPERRAAPPREPAPPRPASSNRGR